MKINLTHSLEFFIPRDPNLIIPPMFLQNVTLNNNKQNAFFNYHFINLSSSSSNNPNLTFAIHLEMKPMDLNLSYLLIYQFDHKSQINSFDDWIIFCPHSQFSLFLLIV